MYEHDVAHMLPAVMAPGLVLHYRGDRLIPFRGAQQLVAGLRNATLVQLDGRVHLPDARDLDQIQKNIVEHVRGGGSHADAPCPNVRPFAGGLVSVCGRWPGDVVPLR